MLPSTNYIEKVGKTVKKTFFNLLSPPVCAGCRKEGHWLCPCCREKLRTLPLIHTKTGPRQLPLTALSLYRNKTVRSGVLLFKYSGVIHYLKELTGELALKTKNRYCDSGFIFVGVPSVPSAVRVRGYNQAQEIAKTLASFFRCEYKNPAAKIKRTPAQAGIKNRKERMLNVADSFRLTAERFTLKDKKLVIVDDVATTGATISELARELKKAKPRSIEALTIAYESK